MGFSKPSVFLLVALGCAGLALLLQIVGLATTNWIHVSSNDHSGLWKNCVPNFVRGNGGEICVAAVYTSSWVEACRAFGVLAVLALVAAVLLAIVSLVMDKAIIKLMPVAAAAAGTFCILIEFAVFAGETSGASYGYSFALTVVAFLLAGASTAFFFINTRTGNSMNVPS